MSATMGGRAIKAPRFSAPMVRCSTSRSSHVTGGTTSTAQRHQHSTGIRSFHSSVNYDLIFLLFLFSFCTLLSFPLSFLYLCPLPSPLLLLSSFSLSNAFTCSSCIQHLLLLLSPSSLSLPYTLLCLNIQSIYSFYPVLSPFLFVLLIVFSMLLLFV